MRASERTVIALLHSYWNYVKNINRARTRKKNQDEATQISQNNLWNIRTTKVEEETLLMHNFN